MKRGVVALCLGGTLVVATVSPAIGGQNRIAVTGSEAVFEILDTGRDWMSGGINHVRGWTAVYVTTGDDYVAGTSYLVVNWNVNVTTGDGKLWGTNTVELDAHAGGWYQTWNATFDAWVWSGQARGHGYGHLDGWQIRLDVWSTGPGTDSFEGYIFSPSN